MQRKCCIGKAKESGALCRVDVRVVRPFQENADSRGHCCSADVDSRLELASMQPAGEQLPHCLAYVLVLFGAVSRKVSPGS